VLTESGDVLLSDISRVGDAVVLKDASENPDQNAEVGGGVLLPLVLAVRDQLFCFAFKL